MEYCECSKTRASQKDTYVQRKRICEGREKVKGKDEAKVKVWKQQIQKNWNWSTKQKRPNDLLIYPASLKTQALVGSSECKMKGVKPEKNRQRYITIEFFLHQAVHPLPCFNVIIKMTNAHCKYIYRCINHTHINSAWLTWSSSHLDYIS